MRNQIKILALLLSFFAVLAACSDEDPGMDMEEEIEMEDLCEGIEPSYSNDIAPIISATCAISGCHVEGFANGDFTSYDGVNARASVINRRAVVQRNMPPSNSRGPDLNDAQRQLINCWIENGALDN